MGQRLTKAQRKIALSVALLLGLCLGLPIDALAWERMSPPQPGAADGWVETSYVWMIAPVMGETYDYTFDSEGRPIAEGSATTYTYDSQGRLSTEIDGEYVTHYDYRSDGTYSTCRTDPQGNEVWWTSFPEGPLGEVGGGYYGLYDYTFEGGHVRQAHREWDEHYGFGPGSETISYSYEFDGQGRVLKITCESAITGDNPSTSTDVVTYAYDANGGHTAVNKYEGGQDTYVFNAKGQLVRFSMDVDGDDYNSFSYVYTYDDAGNNVGMFDADSSRYRYYAYAKAPKTEAERASFKLRSAIADAGIYRASTVASTDGAGAPMYTTWTSQASKDAIYGAMAAAQAVLDDPASTKAQMDAAADALDDALETFVNSRAMGSGSSEGQHLVIFDANGNGSDPAPVLVKTGSKVAEPTRPTADGCTFDGWYADVAGTKKWDFSTPVETNVTLYAKWTEGSPEPSGSVEIYRLYNTKTGEHLYTSSAHERDQLASGGEWLYEQVGWSAPAEGAPVYRLYNSEIDDHLYTDEHEANILAAEPEWTMDNGGRPLFYSGGDVELYRLYHYASGRHLITRDAHEYDVLPGEGWLQEGVKMHGMA